MESTNEHLPSDFNVNAGGACMLAAQIIGRRMVLAGVTEFTIVEGFIQCIEEDGSCPEDMRFAHTWIESQNTEIDPTIEQFSDYIDHYSFHRDVLKTYSPEEYLSDCTLNTSRPENFFDSGIIPSDISALLKLSWGELSFVQNKMKISP